MAQEIPVHLYHMEQAETFDQALEAATANLETYEGKSYDSALIPWYGDFLPSAMRECAPPREVQDLSPFTVVFKLASDGVVEHVLVAPETPIGRCLRDRIRTAHFPNPPQLDYWVRIEMRVEDNSPRALPPQRTPLEWITPRECREHAETIKDSLRQFGITPHPASDLRKMITALEYLGSLPSISLPAPPDAPLATVRDQEKLLASVRLFEQARRIARATNWALKIPGSTNVVRRLKERINRLESLDEQALDYFFELEIAYRLAQTGISIAFEEPDLVARGADPDFTIALACKRPRNVRRMIERIEEGASQITRSGIEGLIIVSLEPILYASPDPTKWKRLDYHPETPDDLRLLIMPKIHAASLAARSAVQKALAKGVRGALFCGFATGWTSLKYEQGGDTYGWFRRAISHPNWPTAATQLDWYLFGHSDTPFPISIDCNKHYLRSDISDAIASGIIDGLSARSDLTLWAVSVLYDWDHGRFEMNVTHRSHVLRHPPDSSGCGSWDQGLDALRKLMTEYMRRLVEHNQL